jgi:hypothetical protein
MGEGGWGEVVAEEGVCGKGVYALFLSSRVNVNWAFGCSDRTLLTYFIPNKFHNQADNVTK